MRFGSLFAGIGGLDLGLERAGMECTWQVEIDEFCQKVLAKHWPSVPKYGDIRDVGRENLEKVDLIAGGFPCQPFSVAGKRRGTEDDRHLWPEMLRVIRELRPTWVLGENVPGIIKIFLDQAIVDLEGEGYTCEPFVLPACSVNAEHKRDRLYIIAYANSKQTDKQRGRRKELSGQKRSSLETRKEASRQADWPTGYNNPSRLCKLPRVREIPPQPTIRGMADGISDRVDRLKSLGNAVVPQVAEHIGRIIMEAAND